MRVGNSHRNTERGAVLFAGMFGIMVLLALGALVVDILRMERIGRSLQRAADSASLAASLHMKGDPYTTSPTAPVASWRKAKRAAVLALRNNLIAEGSNDLANGADWTPAGTGDPYDSTMYGGTDIIIGNLRFTIERGMWLYDEEAANTDGDPETGPYFVPLESEDGQCPEVCSGNNYGYANAVRIRAQMTGMRSFFPLAWAGTTDIGALSREAVGANYPAG